MKTNQKVTDAQAKHFDDLAIKSGLSLYLDTPGYSQSEIYRLIVNAFKQKPNASILEIGSGKGQYTMLLLKHGYSVTANDVSSGALKVLESEAKKYDLQDKLTILLGDITRITKEHGPYDFVFFADTLHHLEFEQTIEILKAIRPLLCSDGQLIAWEPNGKYPFWRQMHLINPDFVWDYEKNITHCTKLDFTEKFTRSGWTMTDYIHHRILPMPLIDKLSFFRVLDRGLMKIPFILSRSAYSIIKARPSDVQTG
jgi:cyclopropane fatty-acyl-phospholipid synthase-like methyltransferase